MPQTANCDEVPVKGSPHNSMHTHTHTHTHRGKKKKNKRESSYTLKPTWPATCAYVITHPKLQHSMGSHCRNNGGAKYHGHTGARNKMSIKLKNVNQATHTGDKELKTSTKLHIHTPA